MKKDWKYIAYLAVVIGIFLTVKLLAPRQYDWSISLAHDDKNPYGSYALNEFLPALFETRNSYQTLYELKDSLRGGENLLILTTTFQPEREDAEALLHFVEEGGSALISAENFYGKFADTLGLHTRDYLFNDQNVNVLSGSDTARLHFSNPRLDTTTLYSYRRDNIHSFFYRADSVTPTVIARNDRGKPVTLLLKRGKGQMILNSTPLIFTNIHLLSGNNSRFASTTLSYLPRKKIWWTEFYHLGRMEARTPLRFVLQNEPLRWAYYISIFSILGFMIFEAKRKQRIIPVIKPLTNTTVEFVATIGNLYFQRSDHKNLADKKILFFFDQIRSRFYLNTNLRDGHFIHALARKSGNSEENVNNLLNLIRRVQQKEVITSEDLVELNEKMELFWNRHFEK